MCKGIESAGDHLFLINICAGLLRQNEFTFCSAGAKIILHDGIQDGSGNSFKPRYILFVSWSSIRVHVVRSDSGQLFTEANPF